MHAPTIVAELGKIWCDKSLEFLWLMAFYGGCWTVEGRLEIRRSLGKQYASHEFSI
jgi:hypothetical protein